jgi:lipoprotein-anchoring transpeptidase ErfK/SrfK
VIIIKQMTLLLTLLLAPAAHGLSQTHSASSPTRPHRIAIGQVAVLNSSLAVYSKPGGRQIANLPRLDSYQRATTLGIIQQDGKWGRISAPQLGDNHYGWINLLSKSIHLTSNRWKIIVTEKRHRLSVLSQGKVVKTILVAVGSSSTPTPMGIYTITDKWPHQHFSPIYGASIFALSGFQNAQLPPSWKGGNHLAIHGNQDPSRIGQNVTLGCIEVGATNLPWLVAHIPNGTVVEILP